MEVAKSKGGNKNVQPDSENLQPNNENSIGKTVSTKLNDHQESSEKNAVKNNLIDRIPPRRFTPDGKVTSVDLTPDGTYVVAGCSDGTIRLYSMLQNWGSEGLILGQIHAKGLITNLIFHVEVTDDGRFAFAGVLRGSVEMFAYDLSKLPKVPWVDDENRHPDEGAPVLTKAKAETLIECYTNLDPKLRGFGAVARLVNSKNESAVEALPEYRLMCGLGIKNLHIWRFREVAETEGRDSQPLWECIFDLVSNGVSIELLAFRAGGLEAVSKSSDQNLRLWDLRDHDDSEKTAFKDINNTQDTRAVFGDYAVGGDCQLSLVRLDICGQLNRMELPLPLTTQVKARRRQLCSVKDIVGTHGSTTSSLPASNQILVICSDGGVHYYEDNAPSGLRSQLIPVHSLTVEEEEDVAFNLAPVGPPAQKIVMVIQTRWLASENVAEILVQPLRLSQPKEEAMAIRKALGELDRNLPTTSNNNNNNSAKKTSPGTTGGPPSGKNSTTLLSSKTSPKTGGDENDPAAAGKSKKRPKTPPSLQSQRKDIRASQQTTTAAASYQPPDRAFVACRPQVRRSLQHLALPTSSQILLPPLTPAPVPYYPIKRKHYDPFAAACKSKKNRNSLDGPPKVIRDLEAKRVLEDAASKTAEFFSEHLARQEVLKELRGSLPSPGLLPEPITGPREEVVPRGQQTWAQILQRHGLEKQVMAARFQAEHDWLRLRFLDAVEGERLTFHVNRVALPSSVKDPIGFLWWEASRMPLKKQWGRYRSFPQQTLEEIALNGLPDITNRRKPFSLTSLICNFKDLASRMVRRHQMEADTLASLQSMDLPFAMVKPFKVEYPYSRDWVEQDPVGQILKQRKDQENKMFKAERNAVTNILSRQEVKVDEICAHE